MGSPGCGKTTTAAAVGHQLGLSVVDVDEYLENFWKTSVANKVRNFVSFGQFVFDGIINTVTFFNQRCYISALTFSGLLSLLCSTQGEMSIVQESLSVFCGWEGMIIITAAIHHLVGWLIV